METSPMKQGSASALLSDAAYPGAERIDELRRLYRSGDTARLRSSVNELVDGLSEEGDRAAIAEEIAAAEPDARYFTVLLVDTMRAFGRAAAKLAGAAGERKTRSGLRGRSSRHERARRAGQSHVDQHRSHERHHRRDVGSALLLARRVSPSPRRPGAAARRSLRRGALALRIEDPVDHGGASAAARFQR